MWPSMKTELPHNFIVVISVNSGAVLYASCEPSPARPSSLGRCSHVVTFHFNEIAFLKIQIKYYILLCFHLLSTYELTIPALY